MKLELEIGGLRFIILLSKEYARRKLQYVRYITCGYTGTAIRPRVCRNLSFKFGKVALETQ